jgi:hypothetical protein
MVIATVALKAGGFPAKVKRRQDCQVVNVTLQNRSTLAGTLVPVIQTILSSHKKGPNAASS